ncbi:hypothetical protein PFISCL1PPCAC_25600, partial [Pristionchus fissidentatus]
MNNCKVVDRFSSFQILSSLLLPIFSPSSLISLRIDAWFSLIFENGETFKPFDAENLASYKSKMVKELSEFSLILTPSYSSKNSIDNSLATEICSDCLKIGSTFIAVSRK